LSRLDPSGLDDFYYMNDKTIINKTDFEDRWFIQHDMGNVIGQGNKFIEGFEFFQANSFETISLYKWSKIDVHFKEDKFVESFKQSLPSFLEDYAKKVGILLPRNLLMRGINYGEKNGLKNCIH
ncbi:MAG: hypothetical protein IPM96_04455, partial [Ignavibacteria bacterium]|nr:hypothetical protein [Ignavibacteria bacterium]